MYVGDFIDKKLYVIVIADKKMYVSLTNADKKMYVSIL